MITQRPLAPVVKGVAATIGLVSEYNHHRKAKTAEDQQDVNGSSVGEGKTHVVANVTNQNENGLTNNSDDDGGEPEWSLDDAQDDIRDTAPEDTKPKAKGSPTEMVTRFVESHPLTPEFQLKQLQLPVVLPQRRPKDRCRGFIRAYAPTLQQCDIDQQTFIDLIEVFNSAILASPWLDALNLASLATLILPTGISQAVAIAIAISVDITKNMQSRHRHDYVLDQLNRDFFRPRGLYALILTWKPESTEAKVGVDINEIITDNLFKGSGLLDKSKRTFRPSMGNTIGVAFSESAPLVFPDLKSLVNDQPHTSEATGFKQKWKNAKDFVGEYKDRRAQAEYAGLNPDSGLAVTNLKFASKFSDPNHPSNSGDMLALVTGGKFKRPLPSELVEDMRTNRNAGNGNQVLSAFKPAQVPNDQKSASVRAEQNQQYLIPSAFLGLKSNTLNTPLTVAVKRIFRHHILYMAIMNMPSDEEMKQASTYLNGESTESSL